MNRRDPNAVAEKGQLPICPKVDDARAYGDFLKDMAKRLFPIAMQIAMSKEMLRQHVINDPSFMKDAINRACMAIYKKGEEWNEIKNRNGWAYTTLKRILLNATRSTIIEFQTTQVTDAQWQVVDDSNRNEEPAEMRYAPAYQVMDSHVDHLCPIKKKIWTLHYGHNVPYAVIAKELNLTEFNTSKHGLRITHAINKKIRDQFDLDSG